MRRRLIGSRMDPRRRRGLVLATAAATIVAASVAACSSSGSQSSASAGGQGSTASSAATGAAPGATKSPIVIGNIGGYTGAEGPDYKQAADALTAWAAYVNASGGLNGHPVQIVEFDDSDQPSTSLIEVKKMVEVDHVDAIAAVMTGGTELAWSSYIEQQKVPVVGGVSVTAPWLTNPYMFSTNLSALSFVQAQYDAAARAGTKAGEAVCAELAGCRLGAPLFPVAAKKAGIGFAGTQFISASAPSYIAPCLAMKSTGANVVVSAVDSQTTQRLFDTCSQQGFTPHIIVPAAEITSAALKDPAMNGAIGVNTAPPWFGSYPLTKQFHQWMAKLYPGLALNGWSTVGWQAGVVLGTALAHAPAVVTPQVVLAALQSQPPNSTFGGWTGPLTYSAGKPAVTSHCYWEVKDVNGQFAAPNGVTAVC